MDTEGTLVLITLEGIDGSGKSTLHQALVPLLEDLDPVFTREPGATWVGDAVRRAIAEQIDPVTEATLFVADHAAHLARVVRPALDAYQSVTLEGVVDAPEQWLRAMHNGWSIVPDRTFLLAVPVDTALCRLTPRNGREHFEKKETLERVQANYLAYAENEPSRFVIIDGMKDPGETAAFVADVIRTMAKEGKGKRRKK